MTHISDVAERLGNDALFVLSRGSKELFHSNLLGWIAEQHTDVFIAAFEPWLVRDERARKTSVRREWRHLDLAVQLAGFAPLVVEAKVFSLPSDEQLKKYGELPAVRALGANARGLLLTLTSPSWTARRFGDTTIGWTAVRFDEIAPGLRGAAQGRSFDHELIRREADLVEMLGELIDQTSLSDDSALFMPDRDRADLEKHRLDLPVQKARAFQFRARVHARLMADGVTLPTKELLASASHGEALTSALWLDPRDDGVGWQLQGGSFTLALVNGSNSGRDGGSRRARVRCADRNAAWFDFGLVHELCGTRPDAERPRSGFNRYDPDFLYRSIRLPADVSLGTMLDVAREYSARAAAYRFAD